MRLDQYLVLKGYAKTRSQASDLIKRGIIEVDGNVLTKPGYDVNEPLIKVADISLFVSRAGEKLLGAIVDFNISFSDKIVIDIGSSTGGFTDCALKQGAKEVYAYDVGQDQMDVTLKNDTRVHLFEGTNVLDVSLTNADIILIDVSFTSIKPILKHIMHHKGEIVALIKPQYEAGPIHFKQGVLKDKNKHAVILDDILHFARSCGFSIKGLKKAHLKGKTGNQEYILYIKHQKNQESIDKLIEGVLC